MWFGQRLALFLAACVLEVSGDVKFLRSSAVPVRLKIVTGGDDVSGIAARNAIANQQAYARRHGYQHEVHAGNYAYPWTAYWHKIRVLLRELQLPIAAESLADVIVWMDLDMVVTNPLQKMLETILSAYPKSAIIITEDPSHGGDLPSVVRAKRLVNTGVMLVRRGRESQKILEKLFEYGRRHTNAAFLPQDEDTLHEQDAFNWLLGGPLGRLLKGRISVIPQRHNSYNLNTFARNLYQESIKDPEPAEWVNGDFTAHCSGLREQQREWCIEDSDAAAEALISSQETSSPSRRHDMEYHRNLTSPAVRPALTSLN